MIRIAITAEAFDAIAPITPFGSVGYEADANGERLIWLPAGLSTGLGRCAGRARATATSSSGWRRRAEIEVILLHRRHARPEALDVPLTVRTRRTRWSRITPCAFA
jgi:hypothetical protein